jgi:2-dehydro-3-deoxyphosphogluconate aldolase/(4S)-4-hydroxy-2-oxoglutarate aldolase
MHRTVLPWVREQSLTATSPSTALGPSVKTFPTETAGVPYAKAVLAPLAHVLVMPAGGVTVENVKEWFAAGVAAVGVGSAVTKAWQPDGDLTRVTGAAREILMAVRDARRWTCRHPQR